MPVLVIQFQNQRNDFYLFLISSLRLNFVVVVVAADIFFIFHFYAEHKKKKIIFFNGGFFYTERTNTYINNKSSSVNFVYALYGYATNHNSNDDGFLTTF